MISGFKYVISKWLGDLPRSGSFDSSPKGAADPYAQIPISITDNSFVTENGYVEGLLVQARELWAQGEWSQLVSLDLSHLEHNPDRAKLCLVIASAQLQLAQNIKARVYLDQALQWGCDKKLVAQLLVAGVHNTLGRAAAVSGNTDKMNLHFGQAVLGVGKSSERSAQQRTGNELAQLDLSSPAVVIEKTISKYALNNDNGYDNFYRAFEDRFRGSRELIKERVRVYLPFVQPLAQRHPNLNAIDLGCGRGEWLEVLAEAGIHAKGIDLDTGMLRECAALGLSVQKEDALAALRQQPTSSSICISLMHVVEHLAFDVVKQLVKEAKRVLVEDGILIMETPNPENFTVGSCNFYLDPTHNNPLPPQLLAFVPEYYGYERIKILRLQEPDGMLNKSYYSSEDFLTGISPDYAVLAQVTSTNSHNQVVCTKQYDDDILWNKDFGISYAFMLSTNSKNKTS